MKWRKPKTIKKTGDLKRPSKAIIKLDKHREKIEQLLSKGVPYISIFKQYRVSRATFYRWLQIREIERWMWWEKIKKTGGLGRPNTAISKLDKHREEIEQLLSEGIPKASILKQYKVSKSTLYRWLQERKIKRE